MNEAIRSDAEPLLTPAVTLTRAINLLCVNRMKVHSVRWPANGIVYRGGGLPDVHRAFFRPGVEYRAPSFVATSFQKHVAINLCRRADESGTPAVMWVFHFDEQLRCDHVNVVERTQCPAEVRGR